MPPRLLLAPGGTAPGARAALSLPAATDRMALRTAAAALARSTSGLAPSAPAVFVRGFAGAVEKFTGGQPVQTKRPAYDERDTPHTDKWLEVSETRDEIGARRASARGREPGGAHRPAGHPLPPLPREMGE